MIPGKYYRVLCVKTDALNDVFYPVIDHPHNDTENGQEEVHYHIDPRFMGTSVTEGKQYTVYTPAPGMRIRESRVLQKEYFMLMYNGSQMLSEDDGITPVNMIARSKLKHRCIHKGKCPHRGYDLSGVEAVAGVITCPLHGLQFNAETLKLKIDESSQASPQNAAGRH